MNMGAPASHSAPQKNIGMALLSYLGILVIIPLITEAKNDPFVKYHIKQGLVLLITCVIGSAVSMVPIIGWILSPFIFLFMIVLAIIGIVNAVGGKEKPLPLIGHYSDKIHI